MTPKQAYENAQKSLFYRLSELVFGSLLASFILGFIAFSSTTLIDSSSWKISLITGATYLLISLSFSYFTAGTYIIFHAGILTLPSYAHSRAKRDFGFSLCLAIAFGIIMLMPANFTLLIGFLILYSYLILRREHTSLVDDLVTYKNSKRSPTLAKDVDKDSDNDRKILYSEISSIIENSKLKRWKKPKWTDYTIAVSLIISGLLYSCGTLISDEKPFERLNKLSSEQLVKIGFKDCILSYEGINFMVTLVLSILIFFAVRKNFVSITNTDFDKRLDKYDIEYEDVRQKVIQIEISA